MSLIKIKYTFYGIGNTHRDDIPLNMLWKDNVVAKWYYILGIRVWRTIIERSPVPMDVYFALACTGFSSWSCPLYKKYNKLYNLEIFKKK